MISFLPQKKKSFLENLTHLYQFGGIPPIFQSPEGAEQERKLGENEARCPEPFGST